ncbi:hypothetical protein [Roseibium alexandrii]|uniref:hypothetical protein n=1 Tax=Roseibium alexandrii TaxID=388408 RepID=UPI003750B9EF
MTDQTAVPVTDQAWVEVADGSEFVTIATQSLGGFLAMVATAQPPIEQDTAAAFYGKAGSPVSYSNLLTTDKVWVRAAVASMTVAVAKSS